MHILYSKDKSFILWEYILLCIPHDLFTKHSRSATKKNRSDSPSVAVFLTNKTDVTRRKLWDMNTRENDKEM